MNELQTEFFYIAGEDIKKNNAVTLRNGKIYNLSNNEYSTIVDEEQLIDELCDYCDLNYMDNVLEIIKDVVRFKQEQTIRKMRINQIHYRDICTSDFCQCNMIEYNQKVKEQKETEEKFRKKNNL